MTQHPESEFDSSRVSRLRGGATASDGYARPGRIAQPQRAGHRQQPGGHRADVDAAHRVSRWKSDRLSALHVTVAWRLCPR